MNLFKRIVLHVLIIIMVIGSVPYDAYTASCGNISPSSTTLSVPLADSSILGQQNLDMNRVRIATFAILSGLIGRSGKIPEDMADTDLRKAVERTAGLHDKYGFGSGIWPIVYGISRKGDIWRLTWSVPEESGQKAKLYRAEFPAEGPLEVTVSPLTPSKSKPEPTNAAIDSESENWTWERIYEMANRENPEGPLGDARRALRLMESIREILEQDFSDNPQYEKFSDVIERLWFACEAPPTKLAPGDRILMLNQALEGYDKFLCGRDFWELLPQLVKYGPLVKFAKKCVPPELGPQYPADSVIYLFQDAIYHLINVSCEWFLFGRPPFGLVTSVDNIARDRDGTLRQYNVTDFVNRLKEKLDKTDGLTRDSLRQLARDTKPNEFTEALLRWCLRILELQEEGARDPDKRKQSWWLRHHLLADVLGADDNEGKDIIFQVHRAGFLPGQAERYYCDASCCDKGRHIFICADEKWIDSAKSQGDNAGWYGIIRILCNELCRDNKAYEQGEKKVNHAARMMWLDFMFDAYWSWPAFTGSCEEFRDFYATLTGKGFDELKEYFLLRNVPGAERDKAVLFKSDFLARAKGVVETRCAFGDEFAVKNRKSRAAVFSDAPAPEPIYRAMENIKNIIEDSRARHPEMPVLVLLDGETDADITLLADSISPEHSQEEGANYYGEDYRNLALSGLGRDVVVVNGYDLAVMFNKKMRDSESLTGGKSPDYSEYLQRYLSKLFEGMRSRHNSRDRIVVFAKAGANRYFKDILRGAAAEDTLLINAFLESLENNRQDVTVVSSIWHAARNPEAAELEEMAPVSKQAALHRIAKIHDKMPVVIVNNNVFEDSLKAYEKDNTGRLTDGSGRFVGMADFCRLEKCDTSTAGEIIELIETKNLDPSNMIVQISGEMDESGLKTLREKGILVMRVDTKAEDIKRQVYAGELNEETLWRWRFNLYDMMLSALDVARDRNAQDPSHSSYRLLQFLLKSHGAPDIAAYIRALTTGDAAYIVKTILSFIPLERWSAIPRYYTVSAIDIAA